MLVADKNATLTGFQIQSMDIRSKELNYFVRLYTCISSMAAFLAGFAFKNLTSKLPENANPFIAIFFLAITASCVGLELCAIVNSTACNMFGIAPPSQHCRTWHVPPRAERSQQRQRVHQRSGHKVRKHPSLLHAR